MQKVVLLSVVVDDQVDDNDEDSYENAISATACPPPCEGVTTPPPPSPFRFTLSLLFEGFVKILSQLSAVDRSTIKSEAILLPDKNGPILFPASSLVYDDAPWLSSRIRTLRLVHPDVGDEVI